MFGLLKRLQEKVKEENLDQDVNDLHCIIHQEFLCKSILQLNHVVNPVVKLVNLIRAKGLQHRQFIAFLEETDADHQDQATTNITPVIDAFVKRGDQQHCSH